MSPNTCVCASGFTGRRCETGKEDLRTLLNLLSVKFRSVRGHNSLLFLSLFRAHTEVVCLNQTLERLRMLEKQYYLFS